MAVRKKKQIIAASRNFPDPYQDKPFKPGDVKTLRLDIPVGDIMISNDLTYRLIADSNGTIYHHGGTFRAYIIKASPIQKDSPAIPDELTSGFLYRIIDLTEAQIVSGQITSKKIPYFFTVNDFNLDGRPDFAFTGSKRYHPYPVKNYVWVNMNGRLVYWHGLSDVCSDKELKGLRMVSIIKTTSNGSYIPKYYYVVKDTFLIPSKTIQ